MTDCSGVEGERWGSNFRYLVPILYSRAYTSRVAAFNYYTHHSEAPNRSQDEVAVRKVFALEATVSIQLAVSFAIVTLSTNQS